MCTQEAETTGGELYLTFGDATLEMVCNTPLTQSLSWTTSQIQGNPYQVDNCSQQSTEIWPGGSMGQIVSTFPRGQHLRWRYLPFSQNNMKYRCDGPLRPFGEFQQSADVIHKRANALGARHQSEAPQKKSFPCTYASCLRTFTTKYRLNSSSCLNLWITWASNLTENLLAHINRFHTAPEQQVSYRCDNCPYTTFYKTDLPRHKKTCSDLAWTSDSNRIFVWIPWHL